MEALAILFAFAVLIAVLTPENKPPPPNPWVKFGDAVEGVLKDLLHEDVSKKVLRNRKPPPSKRNDLPLVIAFSALLGLFLLFGG
jgi:hypothetical protein